MPVVDTHAHWYPHDFVSLLEREAKANGADVTRNSTGNAVFELPGISQKSVMKPQMIEPGLMIESMNERRIDAYVLSLTNPMVYWAPPQFGLELARCWNDASTATHRENPDRFIGTMMLPLQEPDLALPEIGRAAKLPGIRALYMATHVNGRNLDDKSLWPVYAKCEKLGVPILLHPLYPCNPHESAIAAASLIFGGVLDDFPKLDIVLPHAGGSFPWLIGRYDNGVATRHELDHMRQPASAYLRRFYYDTISHSPQIMRFLIDMVGIDRIVVGSDYNFDAGYQRPVEFVDRIPQLSQREREMILSENAAQMLRLHERFKALFERR